MQTIVAESKALEMETDEIKEEGLVISDVSEFVSNLSSTSVFQQPTSRTASMTAAATRAKSEEREEKINIKREEVPDSEDVKMEEADEDETHEQNSRSRTRAESEDEEEETPVKTETEESSTSVSFGRVEGKLWSVSWSLKAMKVRTFIFNHLVLDRMPRFWLQSLWSVEDWDLPWLF